MTYAFLAYLKLQIVSGASPSTLLQIASVRKSCFILEYSSLSTGHCASSKATRPVSPRSRHTGRPRREEWRGGLEINGSPREPKSGNKAVDYFSSFSFSACCSGSSPLIHSSLPLSPSFFFFFFLPPKYFLGKTMVFHRAYEQTM